jgi:formamidopyrimidine-DNA glycosylase
VPELPEVEFGRKLLDEVVVGRKIERVRCADDRIVYAGTTPATVRRRLKGRKVVAARRKGKYLWLELDQRPWPIFHFGMTGAFRVPDGTPLRLESSPKVFEKDWPPRFAKIHLWLSGGREIVMTNARRLGRIRLAADPLEQAPLRGLGFDPHLEMPSLRQFRQLIARRKGVLKGLLLDQSFAAGVGNWIADEVLFQARLDPQRTVASLDGDEVKRLRQKIGHVIETAVRVDARKDKFPKAWLFHRRWGKDADAVTTRGDPIEHLTVAGRTTAWVPAVQR